MKSQITMKDMAQHFNVSLNTIHKAIYGKPGVSEATRKKNSILCVKKWLQAARHGIHAETEKYENCSMPAQTGSGQQVFLQLYMAGIQNVPGGTERV